MARADRSAVAAILAACVGGGLTVPRSAEAAADLVIEGNQVLSDYVYEAVADLDRFDAADSETARTVRRRILEFLRESGYELASVRTSTDGKSIQVRVDEGKLDRIVFPGQDALRAAGMKLALELPKDIFNRKALEAQFPQLERQFGVEIDHFEIRVSEDKEGGLGPGRLVQLERLLERFVELPVQGRYELYVFASREWLPPGFDFDADLQGPDGLTARVLYRFRSAFLEDDRLELIPELGLRVQDVFSDAEGRRFVSRGGFGMRWWSPPIEGLRPFVAPGAVLISRQRLDLGIRSYDFLQVEPMVGVSWPIIEQLRLSFGGGIQYRQLLGLREEDPLPRRDPLDETRLMASFGVGLAFGLDQLRIDRRHRFLLEGRVFPSFQERPLWVGVFRYDKTFGFGLDELVIRLYAESLAGTVSFVDEVRISDHVRGLFGDRFFTEHIGSLRVEYQLAILRDYFKVSAFHDGALFEGVNRQTFARSFQAANAFGIGAHTVLLDAFKVSLYGLTGFVTQTGENEWGVSASVEQLF
ncbi:MAG TPA: hypothetical protein RMG48_15835 [Myxococcales bacterium LLY-WYZ-16_1]|nr:hypothetical protein [Myxococcales bacterium LLY-WYZ-16_1]